MDQNKIGKFILELRKEKNMSQSELAKKIGVTDRAISKWENGRGMTDLSLMNPLCKELGITINDLLSGERIEKKEYQDKLEENIINTINYSNKKIIKSILLSTAIFFSSLFVIPSLGIIAPAFIICGIITPLAGFIKLIGYIFGFDVPFVIMQIGNFEPHPFLAFIISIIFGILLYKAGKKSWQLLIKYFEKVKKELNKL